MINHFEIFGLRITFYGILIMLGALAAAWIDRPPGEREEAEPRDRLGYVRPGC